MSAETQKPVERTYDVPIISQFVLDTICSGCRNHHGYSLLKDTLIISCGADEGTRGEHYHLDLKTCIAEHRLNGNKINVEENIVKSIRAIQSGLPTFDQISVERCDEHCDYQGCNRELSPEADLRHDVIRHTSSNAKYLHLSDPPDRNTEGDFVYDGICDLCQGTQVWYIGEGVDAPCMCTWVDGIDYQSE